MPRVSRIWRVEDSPQKIRQWAILALGGGYSFRGLLMGVMEGGGFHTTVRGTMLSAMVP